MMDWYLVLKWVHILSSTILFGFGAGTAYYFWNAHRTGHPETIARVGRMVVRADWIFTGSSGIIQPLSGLGLIMLAGHELTASWLVVTYGLYALAFACWVPVVGLQIRATELARAAADAGTPLPPGYYSAMRRWFLLGWPAFAGLLVVYWLMVAKPTIW
jgi:uncharacterized membrane protein